MSFLIKFYFGAVRKVHGTCFGHITNDAVKRKKKYIYIYIKINMTLFKEPSVKSLGQGFFKKRCYFSLVHLTDQAQLHQLYSQLLNTLMR